MKNANKLLILALVFVLLLGGAYVLYNRLSQDVEPERLVVYDEPGPTPAAGHESGMTAEEEAAPEAHVVPAPDFRVYDRDGNEVRLSDFFGKPIVLNFWASWCGPCQSEMPDFNEKYLELGDQVHFLMINMTDGSRETVGSASGFIDASGYEFPVFFDSTYEAAITYGVYALPTTFFINADGNLVTYAMRAIDGETLQMCIDLIQN